MSTAKIVRSTIVHEAGHLIVGLLIGIREQGITFRQQNDQAGQAYFTIDSPEKNLRRALAGILAQLELMPGTIEPTLLEPFRISVILDDFHPSIEKIAVEDRRFCSGAKDDMEIARTQALRIVGRDQQKISECLRCHEEVVRTLIRDNRELISTVADDIETWLLEVTPETNPLMLYSPSRAKAILETKRSSDQLEAGA